MANGFENGVAVWAVTSEPISFRSLSSHLASDPRSMVTSENWPFPAKRMAARGLGIRCWLREMAVRALYHTQATISRSPATEMDRAAPMDSTRPGVGM